MATKATTIRFAKEEKEWISSYATFTGQSFSEVVREAVLEKVEDAADYHAYKDAVGNDDGIRIPFEEILKEHGLETL